MQQLLRSRNVDFAVLNAEVVTVNEQRRYGQARDSKSRELLAGGWAGSICCAVTQMNLVGDFCLKRAGLKAGCQ